jgi:hypothetical protein
MSDFLGGGDWLDDWAESSRRKAIQKPVLDEQAFREAGIIHAQQDAFQAVVDELIALYREFNKTRRPDLKIKLKSLYEKLKMLGEKIGVSRVGLDSLWAG